MLMRLFEKYSGLIKTIELMMEVIVLCVVYFIIWTMFYSGVYTQTLYGRGKYILMGIYLIIILIIFGLTDSYKFGHIRISVISISQCISMLLVNFVSYLQLSLMANIMINPLPILMLCVIDFCICLLCCYWYTRIYHANHKPRSMLMIYTNDNALELANKLSLRPDKYDLNRSICTNAGEEKIIEEINNYDAVIINDVHAQLRNDLVKYCYRNNIRTYLVPKISDIIISGSDSINLFDTPLELIDNKGMSFEQELVKRFFDILLSLIALIVLSPVMAATSALIKLEDGGPVFFRQDRVTKNEKVFSILKFRSMKVDAESGGYTLDMRAIEKDPRITKIGHFIRATRIDEIPQLINILKGDMSIVGPRPERVENHNEYTKIVPEWPLRTKVKGGLTGYAQIYGKYNTTPYDKVRLDLEYITNYSLLLDIKLIFMTLQILVQKESTEGFKKKEDINNG